MRVPVDAQVQRTREGVHIRLVEPGRRMLLRAVETLTSRGQLEDDVEALRTQLPKDARIRIVERKEAGLIHQLRFCVEMRDRNGRPGVAFTDLLRCGTHLLEVDSSTGTDGKLSPAQMVILRSIQLTVLAPVLSASVLTDGSLSISTRGISTGS